MPSSVHKLMALKASHQSRSLDEKRSQERHRDCLVLILAHLRSCGYVSTASELQKEGGTTLSSRYEVADNIDLLRILRDYEDFYDIKFGRKPRYSRKTSSVTSMEKEEEHQQAIEKKKHASAARRRISQRFEPKKDTSSERPTLPSSSSICSG